MHDDAPEPAEILDIKRLVKAQFRAAGRQLVHAHTLQVLSRPALVFTEELLDHYLVNDVSGSERHKAEDREPKQEEHYSHGHQPVYAVRDEGETPLEPVQRFQGCLENAP
jgi:hypothetical protein